MLSVTWRRALGWRLRRHLLDPVGADGPVGAGGAGDARGPGGTSGPTSAADVIGRLVAVAAQLDPESAELGVRTRCRASRPGDVGRAVADGAIVATFAFRGAVHLMTPDLAAVHLALRAASRMWERPGWQDFYGLAPDDWPVLRAAVREALTDGPLTRAELAAAVTADPRFAHLADAFTLPSATFVKPFAWQGDVSLGPSHDGRLTFQRLDANPRWTGLPTIEDAGRRAVEAYLRAYGPASPENLAYWLTEGLGVRRTRVREWTADLGDRVRTVSVDGEDRLVLREDLDELAAAEPTGAVRLLPRYDQWVLGPGTADTPVVPAEIRADVSHGADLVVVGGVVAGTWTLNGDTRDARDTVRITWAPGTEAPSAAELDAEVARLATLVGRSLRAVSDTL